MKLTGQVINMRYDFRTNTTQIVINAEGDILEQMEEYLKARVNIAIDKWYARRTKRSNSFMWVLLGELQRRLGIPKEDIYTEYIHRVGAYEVIHLKNKAVNKFISSWSSNGLGWICEIKPSNEEGYTDVLAYYGSSVYDTKQMNQLNQMIVDDCLKFGIETRSEEDLKSLLGG